MPNDRRVASAIQTTNLADILERVLDKGIVIAGDITISLVQVELLSIKVRLLIASVDKAREIGIDWWERDKALTSHAAEALVADNMLLKERLAKVEAAMASHV
jgi:hypothetical protein